ncbi:MAG: 1-deoxy-D-xylulose-5-phosphate reductoisomerase [Bacteroidales bacterium]|nr:1-deoxy-D-xylulose-5-phosphate reductoisomerase [Bacteroidales bacterium]
MQNQKKNLAIFGSTGSIGTQALEIVAAYPDLFSVEVLVANNNIDLLVKQARIFKPNVVVVGNDQHYKSVKDQLQDEYIQIYAGEKAVCQVMEMDSFQLVIMAIVGFAALNPTLAAIRNKKTIALANKECLVVAGEHLSKMAVEYKSNILPVDSEHSAIFQCLMGEAGNDIEKIILTASGGPFYNLTLEEMARVTPQMALHHPNWNMGNKVTIDSATLMNKGLEAMEASWLFGVKAENIEILIHPQSIVHSMVTFSDGSTKAQLSQPDMRLPIQYAMTFPNRIPSLVEPLNLATVRSLTFETPDVKKFRNLALAFEALQTGGSLPCVLNASNEMAVQAFLEQKIGFLNIPEIVEESMLSHELIAHPSIGDYVEIDRKARLRAQEIVKRY